MFDDFFDDLEEWRHEKMKEYAYEDGYQAGQQALDAEEINAQYEQGFGDGVIVGRG